MPKRMRENRDAFVPGSIFFQVKLQARSLWLRLNGAALKIKLWIFCVGDLQEMQKCESGVYKARNAIYLNEKVCFIKLQSFQLC